MDALETTTHSFIVKIWLEEAAEDARPALWRGQITRVPGGERYPIVDLQQIVDVIEPYLAAAGVKFPPMRRARPWLTQCKRTLTRRG